MKTRTLSFVTILLFSINQGFAQNDIVAVDSSRRVITTAVPFLMISPDARAGAMGETGVATTPDANTTHWNIAKLPFIKKDYGFSLSYSPWLSHIVGDMSLTYLSGYYKINKQQAVAFSMNYFDLGNIQFTDENGSITQDFVPREYAFAASYARVLSENMSIGVTLKYIYSNLTGNYFAGTLDDSQPGVALAGDLGWYWNKDIGQNSNLATGVSITNIGNKVTYTDDNQKEFIPINLRFGSAYEFGLDPHNTITLALDFNKLMVPTPPVYGVEEDGDKVIVRGEDPDRPLLSGMFGSFTDAPDGAKEEFQEIMICSGVEYWYKELFSVRGGYFWEHYNKGNRKYFTTGVGLRYNTFGIDFAYLIPTEQEHPLKETLRFSIHFNFADKKGQESILQEDAK